MRIFFIIFFFFLWGISLATDIDSLKKSLKEKDLSNQFSTLLDLAWHDDLDITEREKYARLALKMAQDFNNSDQQLEALKILASIFWSNNDIENAKIYFKEMDDIAVKINDLQVAGTANNSIGLIFQKTSRFDSALIYYQKAVDRFHACGNAKDEAVVMVNTGIIYKNIGFYKDAVEITMQGANIAEQQKDTINLAAAYNNLGNALKELKNYTQAEYYLTKALEIRVSQNDKRAQAGVLNNLGNVYRHWGKLNEALVKYNDAYTIKVQLGDKILLASTIDNLGEVHMLMGDLQLAETFFKHALQLRTEADYMLGITISCNRLSNFFLERHELDSAYLLAIQALNYAQLTDSRKDRLESYKLLTQILEKKGNIKYALLYSKKYSALYDSLFSEEKAQTIANIEVKYRTEQYIKELALSIEKEKAQKIEIKNQYLLIGILVVAFSSILIIALLLYRNYTAKKKAETVEKMLRKEIQHRVKNNLQLISNMNLLQMAQTQNPDVKKVLQENENRVQSINLIHQSLYKSSFKNNIDIKQYISALFKNLKESFLGQTAFITTEFTIDELFLPVDTANSLGLILNELLTNAFKYSFTHFTTPDVSIKLQHTGKHYTISITHSSLFWDFDVAKHKSESFGLTLVEMLIEQLEGELTIDIANKSTEYIIIIPAK